MDTLSVEPMNDKEEFDLELFAQLHPEEFKRILAGEQASDKWNCVGVPCKTCEHIGHHEMTDHSYWPDWERR